MLKYNFIINYESSGVVTGECLEYPDFMTSGHDLEDLIRNIHIDFTEYICEWALRNRDFYHVELPFRYVRENTITVPLYRGLSEMQVTLHNKVRNFNFYDS